MSRPRIQPGSFLEKGISPKEGMEVWARGGDELKTVRKGTITLTFNIDKKGLANTYVDLTTVDGKNWHLPVDCLYDHKPRLVEVEDQFGRVKVWQ